MRETEGLINQGLTATPEQSEQRLMSGVGDSRGLLSQDSGNSMNQNLSFGDQALSGAIRNKYSKPFEVRQSGLENRVKLDARNEYFAKLQTAHQLASEEANLNFQKELVKYKQKMQKRAQRQQLVGQVLGIAGGALGGAYGGPAGAAGGSAAGQAIGSSDPNKI